MRPRSRHRANPRTAHHSIYVGDSLVNGTLTADTDGPHPAHTTSGTSFDSVLAVGGDPGSAGLLWFDRARIGGVAYGGISTVVSTGLLNANGIFRTQLNYQPSILPLQAGDQLFFEGFNWNGNTLLRTGE